ncbi:two-component transcriptional regulator, winged helix family [Edwardsiella piscicida]|nr:two-component transcriptional regulator, winged helix family [Edwardsiella piscicida]
MIKQLISGEQVAIFTLQSRVDAGLFKAYFSWKGQRIECANMLFFAISFAHLKDDVIDSPCRDIAYQPGHSVIPLPDGLLLTLVMHKVDRNLLYPGNRKRHVAFNKAFFIECAANVAA